MGIDVYHPLVWGSRDALRFGLLVTISTALFGVLYGATSGFVGNRLGNFMIRLSDSFLAFPPIAGVVLLQQLYVTSISAAGGYVMPTGEIFTLSGEPLRGTLIQSLLEHVNPLMLSLIVFSWMSYARLVHSIVLTLKQTEFVQAARALGGSTPWIIRKHILRNSTGPAIVLAARDVGGVVLLQATLTFIRIGGDSIWGQMLAQGRNWVIGPGGSLLRYWWVFLPPTLAVMLFGIAWNMFGDGLNDVLEPTSQGALRGPSFWSRIMQRDEKESPSEADRIPESIPEPLPQEVSSSDEQSAPTQPVPRIKLSDRVDPLVIAARGYLSDGDRPRALHAFGHLVRRGRAVDEFLPDLAQLAKRHPRDPQVWQTLGDALERLGQADRAAQCYERSRTLIQQDIAPVDPSP
jgi:peptide/nickel transport system permease protein